MLLPRLLLLLQVTLLATVSANEPEHMCTECEVGAEAVDEGPLAHCNAALRCRQGGDDHGTCDALYNVQTVYRCPRPQCGAAVYTMTNFFCRRDHYHNCRCQPTARARLARILSAGSSSKSKVHPR
ncbi:hypothetical protein PTTG_29256 [Puccinia triticina 1-1 BBBD Race 1]|uniref:Uncharacterized protein n=1 Tax=Puccinia triticina (isolate 1-1 / race 1 (BBBD)) TaxID=630390 RepID=A0A180G609_PUCT1|nr:hypothetical protein PTTG_29256 [Puccinia triticina 1-1 BBBD Race 1]